MTDERYDDLQWGDDSQLYGPGPMTDPNQCVCGCHYPSPGFSMMHFRACCDGWCKTCGKWYIDLKKHECRGLE